jgi:hypothetical protein
VIAAIQRNETIMADEGETSLQRECAPANIQANERKSGGGVELPRPTPDQDAYLRSIQSVAVEFDQTVVIGGACRYESDRR